MSNAALSVQVGADVTDLRTKLALAQSDVKTFSAETRDLAQQMRDSSAAAQSALLPQLQASAKAAGDAKSQVASLTAELRGNAQAANENAESAGHVTSALGSNRAAFMELEHSARASADALAAGADPMRVLAMEAPRVVQALTELGPGAMAAIVSPAGAAVAATAAFAAGLVYLAIKAGEATRELEAVKTQMLLAGNLNPSGLRQYADNQKNLADQFGYSSGQAKSAALALAGLHGPATQYSADLATIAAAWGTVSKQDPEKAFADVVKAANGGSEAFMKWAESAGFLTESQKSAIIQAAAGHNAVAGIGATVEALNHNWVDVIATQDKAKNSLAEYYKTSAQEGALNGEFHPEFVPHDAAPVVPDLPSNVSTPDPEADRTAATERAYNQTLQERTGILADIKTLEGAIATASDPAQRAKLENALDEARMKAVQLHTAAENQAYELELGHIRQTAAAAEQGSQAKINALKQEAEAIRQRNTLMDDKGAVVFDGQYSQQYQEAEAKIAEAVRENQTKNRAEYAQTEAALQRVIQTAMHFSATMHNLTAQLTADLSRGNDRIDAMGREFTATQNRMSAAMRKNQQEVNTLILQPYRQAFQGVTNSFNQSITGMIDGSMTFSQAMQNLAKGVLDTFVNMGLQMVEKWAEQQMEKLILGEVTESTGALASITSAAAVAAANTFASISAIPYVGPALAPEAAAASYSQVMAYQGLAALDVGTPNVPADMLANIHKGEIVVPASFSDGLRSGDLTLGGSNDNSPSGGDTHVHIHPGAVQVAAHGKTSAHDLADLKGAVTDIVADAIAGAKRKLAFAR